jgi:hypothetical protein
MCSVTAMRPALNRAIPHTPRPKLLLNRAMSALTGRGPFASPFRYGWGRLQRLRTATRQHFGWSVWVWSPPPESNRRPHPYHESRAHRCADRRFRRSPPTVDRQVMCSSLLHFSERSGSGVALDSEHLRASKWQPTAVRNRVCAGRFRPSQARLGVLMKGRWRPRASPASVALEAVPTASIPQLAPTSRHRRAAVTRGLKLGHTGLPADLVAM